MQKQDTDNLLEQLKKDEEHITRDKKLMPLLITIVGIVVLMFMILIFYEEDKTTEITSTNFEDRFEIIYEQDLPTDQCKVRILVDRDTDVEYLMVYDKVSHDMSITLMRDKGGMVLLRE